MPRLPRIVRRAAGRIHDALTAAAARPLAIGLSESGWSRCQQLAHALTAAEQRGGTTTARLLRSRLSRTVDELRAELNVAAAALYAAEWTPTVPTLRLLTDELVALDDEFDAVEINLRRQTLSVTTKPIELEQVPLGRFEIRLAWRELANPPAYKVIALDPNPAPENSALTHPHVQQEYLCEGDGQHAIQRALHSGRLSDFFLIVQQVLSTYNAESAYVSLRDWHGSSCSDCGRSVAEFDECTCERCEARICPDCSHWCSACEQSTCSSCQRICDGCDEETCPQCRATCRDCAGGFCQDCLTEGRCARCRAADEPSTDGDQPADPSGDDSHTESAALPVV